MAAPIKKSASPSSLKTNSGKPVVAILGGNGRRPVTSPHYEVETFTSRREGGNGAINRLLSAITSGRLDFVVLMTRWLGHPASQSVVAACKRYGVRFKLCVRGLTAAKRMLEAEFGVREQPPAAGCGVVLVDLYWTRDKDPRVPLGHASILAALRAANIATTSVVRAVNQTPLDATKLAAELVREAAALGPDAIIAIGAYVWAEHIIQPLLPALRAAGFAEKIVLGGPQISYSGPGLEATYPDADVFVRGYGEQALVALALDGEATVEGAHRAGENDVCQQAKVELDTLPSPWSTSLIPLADQRFVRWETQRGCPYRCSFCQHREAGARLEWRDLDCERLLGEIEMFVENGVQQIAVLDPIFNVGANATPVLKAFVERGFKGELSLQCRPEKLSEEFLALAAQLNVCLEFGLQTIHRDESKAVKRANNMKKVEEALARVRELGLRHEVSLIFGLPEQTLASFYASVRWCLEQQVPVIKAFPLLLLRGTQLDLEREQWGYEATKGAMGMVTCSNSFNRNDWFAMACLSEALKQTEGQHPSFEELIRLAKELEPDVARWIASEV